jgi:Zn-dependent protease with chaperone function
MAMTNQEFETLVARLDEEARQNPSAYKFRVLMLAGLGYGYLALTVLFLLALTLAAFAAVVFLKAIALKIAIPLLIFLFVVLKAMWVKLDPPEGRLLAPAEAPALFALIDALRHKLKSPPFHRVLITNDFNAAVVQIPRLGMLGWHRNYLLIGLPLMKALTPAQLEAVLAHEFGHLAGGHARVSNWIYRLRMSWMRLMAILEHNKSWGTGLFRPFFNWYSPYFNAYSFPLARANEYEADGASARIVSPQAAAEALTSVNVAGAYLDEKYWPGLQKEADDTPRPGFSPYARMGEDLAGGIDETSAQQWLGRAMEQQTTVANTHPSLADRLKAIQETPRIALPAPGAAADNLLGSARESITAEFDQRWHDAVLPHWEKRHREVQEGRAKLAELDQRAAGELALDDAYERAKLTEAFGAGADTALELFRQVHARAPDDALYNFALAQRLLARDDASGVAMMELAMAKEADAIAPGCEFLRDYCWRTGQKDQAHAWHARLEERMTLLHKAQGERAEIFSTDKFERHGLPDEAVAALREQLRAIPRLRKVYLVRKQVKVMPERPLYALGFTFTPWWWSHNKTTAAELQQQILATVQCPVETIVFCVEGGNYQFARKFRVMRGSRIL